MPTSHKAGDTEGQRAHCPCGSSSWFCRWLAVWLRVSCLTALSLSFMVRRIGESRLPHSFVGRVHDKKAVEIPSTQSALRSLLSKCEEAETVDAPRRVGGRSPSPPPSTHTDLLSPTYPHPVGCSAEGMAEVRDPPRETPQTSEPLFHPFAVKPGSHSGG